MAVEMTLMRGKKGLCYSCWQQVTEFQIVQGIAGLKLSITVEL